MEIAVFTNLIEHIFVNVVFKIEIQGDVHCAVGLDNVLVLHHAEVHDHFKGCCMACG